MTFVACKASSSRSRGFSLIEVLVAMLILSIGAASVLALFVTGASTLRRAVDRTQAALLAERVFCEMRFLYDPGDEPEGVVAKLAERLPRQVGDYTFDVLAARPSPTEGSGEELFVRVAVRWLESGKDRTEAFHTIILPRHTVEARSDR